MRSPRTLPIRYTSTLLVAIVLVVAGCSNQSSKSKGATVVQAPRPRSALVAGGARFSVELDAHGHLFTWGHNATGELGDGTSTLRARPVAVGGIATNRTFVAIAAGANHALAVDTGGNVVAWGHNRSGQLGDGTRVDRLTPIEIRGLHDVRAVAAGDGFSMALEGDGAVLAWGNNQSGQLGDGNAPEDHTVPAAVHDLRAGSGVVQIAAGSSQAFVRKADGSVFGWGNGTSGQLGDGANDKQSAPAQVIGLGPGSGVVDIVVGGSHAMALKSDGTVLAWGNNKSGQLGDGTRPTDHNRPVPVSGLAAGSGVVALAAGSSFSMALKSDGTVLAWGKNKVGELGDGTFADHSKPVEVKGLPPTDAVRTVSAGDFHSLAVDSRDAVLAWGDNSSGQLGDGTEPSNHPLPVTVATSGRPS